MAKDVDLSSKEWRDLIFEGKNKDFGAYKMRQASDGRHNKAFIIVVIALVDEPEEIEEVEEIEIEVPDTPPEEILNQQKMTEIAIVPDDQVSEEDEVKSQTDLEQNTAIAGALDFDDGTDDISKITEQKVEIIQEKPKEEKKEQVFRHVEQMPEFPGGEAALMKYINDNIRYPVMAIENGVQGRVTVQFVVTKDGSVGNVTVLRGVDRNLDEEAVRVCKTLPKFIPGKQNGQPVNVWFTLPVTFRLE